MIYKINVTFWGLVTVLLTILFVAGIRFYVISGFYLSAKDFLVSLGFLLIYLTIIINWFLVLEVNENAIVRKRNTVIFNSNVDIPYSKIIKVFRSFWFVWYIYTIEAEIDGKRIWLHLNLFSRHKEILRKIVSKIDKSIVDEDVLKAIKQNVK